MNSMFYAISLSVDDKDAPRDFLYTDYCRFFERFGCRLICLPNATDGIVSYFNDLPVRGIILSGGNDLSPGFSGWDANDARNVSVTRDINEKRILDLAVERKIPVLGICRGMQFINCYFGGSITCDVGGRGPDEGTPHVRKDHLITICDERGSGFFGKKEIEVNSYHHHGVKKEQVASGLNIMAVCSRDGIVEAIYHPSLPIAGVQWHPERLGPSPDADDKLVRAFTDRNLYWEAGAG